MRNTGEKHGVGRRLRMAGRTRGGGALRASALLAVMCLLFAGIPAANAADTPIQSMEFEQDEYTYMLYSEQESQEFFQQDLRTTAVFLYTTPAGVDYSDSLQVVSTDTGVVMPGEIQYIGVEDGKSSYECFFTMVKEGGAVLVASVIGHPEVQSSILMYLGHYETVNRVYNPNSGEHFYTKDADEYKRLVSYGWKGEGTAWSTPNVYRDEKVVHRLYNPNVGDHHYTMDAGEIANLTQLGWIDEGAAWYSYGTGHVYRLYNPNAVVGTHHYTADRFEYYSLVRSGWQAEGIAW